MPIIDSCDKVIYTNALYQISWMPLGSNSRGEKFFYDDEKQKYEICVSVDDYKKNVKKLGYIIKPLEDLYVGGLNSLIELSKNELLINGEIITEITSFSQLTKHFGISAYRIRKIVQESGVSREQAYKQLMIKKVVVDHLGNEFLSKNEMYRFWGKNKGIVTQRLKQGYSLKDALEKKISKRQVTDHLGKKYKNKKEMLREYGVIPTTFERRLKKGLTLEEALTNPSRTSHKKTEVHVNV